MTPILSLYFNYQNSVNQSLRSVLCCLLRQLIACQKPISIPDAVLEEWHNAKLSGQHSLDEQTARSILQNLSTTLLQSPYLVIDALDEAEGCRESIHGEIHWLRKTGFYIFSTEVEDKRKSNDSAYCHWHQSGPGRHDPLELYWQCKECPGRFGKGVEICQDCFINKNLRCEDSSHTPKLPGRVHVEIKAPQQDMERFAQRFLEAGSTGGDIGDDDVIFSGNMTLLAMLRADIDASRWNEIPSEVAKAANGNFLHAQLFLDRLKEQRHVDGAISLLQQLQSGSLPDINRQYKEKLDRCMQGSGAEVARDHLTIVAAAEEVL